MVKDQKELCEIVVVLALNVFSVWPAGGRAIYGWFLICFER
jgi:hypothetical protein